MGLRDTVTKAIRNSRFVLACLSKASITKAGYVQKELRKALDVAEEQPEGAAYLIPVRLEDCEIPERLRRWQWVDLFKDGGYERLLRSLGATAAVKVKPTRAISSNEFNVHVATAVQQTWLDCFGDRSRMEQMLTRSDGGVDGVIWSLQSPGLQVAFKTFPSPDKRLRSFVLKESLSGLAVPCLIVTRLAIHPGTRVTIENAYPYALQFLRYDEDLDDEELEISLRILRAAAIKYRNDQFSREQAAFMELAATKAGITEPPAPPGRSLHPGRHRPGIALGT